MIPKVETRLRTVEKRVRPVQINQKVIIVPREIPALDWPWFIAGELEARQALGQGGGCVVVPEEEVTPVMAPGSVILTSKAN